MKRDHVGSPDRRTVDCPSLTSVHWSPRISPARMPASAASSTATLVRSSVADAMSRATSSDVTASISPTTPAILKLRGGCAAATTPFRTAQGRQHREAVVDRLDRPPALALGGDVGVDVLLSDLVESLLTKGGHDARLDDLLGRPTLARLVVRSVFLEERLSVAFDRGHLLSWCSRDRRGAQLVQRGELVGVDPVAAERKRLIGLARVLASERVVRGVARADQLLLVERDPSRRRDGTPRSGSAHRPCALRLGARWRGVQVEELRDDEQERSEFASRPARQAGCQRDPREGSLVWRRPEGPPGRTPRHPSSYRKPRAWMMRRSSRRSSCRQLHRARSEQRREIELPSARPVEGSSSRAPDRRLDRHGRPAAPVAAPESPDGTWGPEGGVDDFDPSPSAQARRGLTDGARQARATWPAAGGALGAGLPDHRGCRDIAAA